MWNVELFVREEWDTVRGCVGYRLMVKCSSIEWTVGEVKDSPAIAIQNFLDSLANVIADVARLSSQPQAGKKERKGE